MEANRVRSIGACLVLAGLCGCQGETPAGPVRSNSEVEEEEAPAPDSDVSPDAAEELEVVYPGVPPAVSGGTLALSADGLYAVAADPDRDQVHVVDVKGGLVRSATVLRGSEPGRVALDSHGQAHIVLRGAGKLARVSLESGSIVQETPVCSLPRGVVFDAQREAVVVACAEGALVALAASDHSARWRTQLDRDLRDVVIDAKGKLFVSRFRSAELLEVSSAGELVSRRHAPTTQRTSFRFFLGLAEPTSKATGADASGVLPGTSPGALTMAPTLAWRTMVDASGAVVMLHQRAQVDEVSVEPGGYGFGGCESITQTGFSTFSAEGAKSGLPLSGATLAVDASFSADGDWVAIAAAGEVALSLRDPTQAAPTHASLVFPVGPTSSVQIFRNQPTSADPTLEPSFGCQFPWTRIPSEQKLGQAIAVAFDAKGRLFAQSREPAQLGIFEHVHLEDGSEGFQQTQTIVLSDQSASHPGHDLFHANVGGGLACASCHGEALDDAHVWTFADVGPRRTQTMRGGLLGTEPFHWAGDLSGFRHLVDEVMTKRMSGFQASDADVEALATWIHAQPALRAERRASPAAARGEALFASAEVGCSSCHSGTMLTNNESVDVGTGKTLQVPSLRGLALRAPYMHDGCAQSLKERFTKDCGGGDRHGKTSQLSESELADLIAYLETL